MLWNFKVEEYDNELDEMVEHWEEVRIEIEGNTLSRVATLIRQKLDLKEVTDRIFTNVYSKLQLQVYKLQR